MGVGVVTLRRHAREGPWARTNDGVVVVVAEGCHDGYRRLRIVGT